jgi:hypothetical protein
MRYRNKLLFLLLVLLLLVIIQYSVPNHPEIVSWYSDFIFLPFQTFRNTIFGIIPFSIGDILYSIAAVGVIVIIVRWLYLIIRVKTHVHTLNFSLIRTVSTIGVLYIIFFAGWGGNYYKPTLSKYWKLDKGVVDKDSDLIQFDMYLLNKLNDFAPHYHALSFKEINSRAQMYYHQYTDSKTRLHVLKVKPSVFGFFMQYIGIQGYYNPFTGEAQLNRYQPAFMLPFVICHEMAHQAGIAAEGDANLMAYALGTTSKDTSFNYSCYLNLWLYTNSRLRLIDSNMANNFRNNLNAISRKQLDTLRNIRYRYQSEVGYYSTQLYDSYLRWHHQKEGIESYSKVASTAWRWEQRHMLQKDSIIRMP